MGAAQLLPQPHTPNPLSLLPSHLSLAWATTTSATFTTTTKSFRQSPQHHSTIHLAIPKTRPLMTSPPPPLQASRAQLLEGPRLLHIAQACGDHVPGRHQGLFISCGQSVLGLHIPYNDVFNTPQVSMAQTSWPHVMTYVNKAETTIDVAKEVHQHTICLPRFTTHSHNLKHPPPPAQDQRHPQVLQRQVPPSPHPSPHAFP